MGTYCWAVVVAQLTEQSLPIPEDQGSNSLLAFCRKDKNKVKSAR